MRVAFLILAHSDPVHFRRLVQILSPHGDIFIHIDKKADISTFLTEVPPAENVHYIEDRVSIAWAGISMIDAQNQLLNRALCHSEQYSHLLFLSGSCYPIKPVNDLVAYLSSMPEYNFIKYIDMRESPDIYLRQVTQKWFKEPFVAASQHRFMRMADKLLRFLLNKLALRNGWKEEIFPYFGSQWVALTAECAKYVVQYQKDNPWYREMNRYSFSPDEHYFHTIIGNSKFAMCSDGLQPFLGRGTWRFANLHIIDKSLAKWYTQTDFDEIKNSEKFFVRKVRSTDGRLLVDKIDQELLSDCRGL